MAEGTRHEDVIGIRCEKHLRVSNPKAQKNWMDGQGKEGTAKGVTLLDPSLTAYNDNVTTMVKFEPAMAAVVRGDVWPQKIPTWILISLRWRWVRQCDERSCALLQSAENLCTGSGVEGVHTISREDGNGIK